jgi:hypothetical protein
MKNVDISTMRKYDKARISNIINRAGIIFAELTDLVPGENYEFKTTSRTNMDVLKNKFSKIKAHIEVEYKVATLKPGQATPQKLDGIRTIKENAARSLLYAARNLKNGKTLGLLRSRDAGSYDERVTLEYFVEKMTSACREAYIGTSIWDSLFSKKDNLLRLIMGETVDGYRTRMHHRAELHYSPIPWNLTCYRLFASFDGVVPLLETDHDAIREAIASDQDWLEASINYNHDVLVTKTTDFIQDRYK